jgi:excinuclease ABC subunit A
MQKEVRGSQPPRDGAERRRAGRRRAGARGDAANEFAIRHSPFAIPSHTGAALRPALEQGTRVARERYDPAVHAEREMKVERARLGDVGKETRMPWQVDGRNWHLAQRDDRNGKPRRWQPAALEYVEELIQKAGRGKFAPTHWSNRASVEITAPGAHTWFLHALTGGEWLLELYFRAPPGTFGWRKLDEELELKTLDQRPDIQAYGDWARVDVRKRRDGFDAIVVYAHDKAEIDTPAFRRFVRKAVQAYLGGGSAP